MFREIFEKKQRPARVKNTDLFVIGGGIVLVLIAILVRSARGVQRAWPPLSGAGGVATDVFFYVLAVGLSTISIYILVRTFGWVRSLKKERSRS